MASAVCLQSMVLNFLTLMMDLCDWSIPRTILSGTPPALPPPLKLSKSVPYTYAQTSRVSQVRASCLLKYYSRNSRSMPLSPSLVS